MPGMSGGSGPAAPFADSKLLSVHLHAGDLDMIVVGQCQGLTNAWRGHLETVLLYEHCREQQHVICGLA